MNQFILDAYRKLSTLEKAKLKQSFADSPKMLRLIDLVEKNEKKFLHTYESVVWVYKGAKEEFGVLRNRFFKLRKKLAETLEKGSAAIQHTGIGVEPLPLETELIRCRKLIADGSYMQAAKRIEQLHSACYKDQIIELLPEIFQHKIFIAQSLNRKDEFEKLFADWEHVNKAHAALLEMRMIYRKIHELVQITDYTFIDKLYLKLQKLAAANSDYPRLRFYYHFTRYYFTSMYRENVTGDVHLHLRRCNKLLEKHPGMPAGLYEAGATSIIHFQLLLAQSSFAYRINNTEEAYQLHTSVIQLMENTPELKNRRSDALFTNLINFSLVTGRYKEALETCNKLMEFYREQGIRDRQMNVWFGRQEVYQFAWPHLLPDNPQLLFRKTTEHLKQMKEIGDPRYPLYQMMDVIAKIQFGNRAAGLREANTQEVRKSFTDYGFSIYNELFDTLRNGWTAETEELLRKKISGLIENVTDASRSHTLNTLYAQLKYFAPKK